MDDDLSLKAAFDGLAGRSDLDPHDLLGAHGDLPADLLATALGSYAETAPAEVAEHLAPLFTGKAEPASGLDLLAGAPPPDSSVEVALGEDAPGDDAGSVDLDGLDAADLLDDLDGPDAADDAAVPDDAGTDQAEGIDDAFGEHAVETAQLPDPAQQDDVPDDDFDLSRLDEAGAENSPSGLDDDPAGDQHEPFLHQEDLDDHFGDADHGDPADHLDDLDGLDG